MRIIREIGEKGQVVIPKDIREMLNLRKGKKIVFEIKDREVLIKPEEDVEEFLKDFFNIPEKLRKPINMKKIKKTIEEQYELP